MHMADCLNGELIEEYDGGHASVFQDKHEGCPVAIKIVRLYLTSDFDKSLSVKILFLCLAEVTSDHSVYRDSAEKLLCGGTSDTETSYRCLV